jgi:uncharacterized protein YndB with AHSA1/START domain
MTVVSMTPYLEPVRKSVTVPLALDAAFHHFVHRLGSWWPLANGHSIFGERTRTCAIEPRVGGAIFEESTAGERGLWGRILHWDPPHRVEFTWFPGRAEDTAQTVELRFTAVDSGTRLDLEHRGWQHFGAEAAAIREQYDGGWGYVLGTFVRHASSGGHDA